MAIGCAKCLGYDLNRNFNIPYISKNISVFWKRWHISLSTWLMEYLYIPLGGNRKGKFRTYINLIITMLLGGLWHGANWTFVVWGGMHGIALCVHKLWMSLRGYDKNHKGTPLGNLLSSIVTYAFVTFCFIFFRAETFTTASTIIRGIICWQDGIMYISTWAVMSIALIGIATLIPVLRSLRTGDDPEGFYPFISLKTIPGLTLLFILLGFCMILAYTGNNPFIYFQF